MFINHMPAATASPAFEPTKASTLPITTVDANALSHDPSADPHSHTTASGHSHGGAHSHNAHHTHKGSCCSIRSFPWLSLLALLLSIMLAIYEMTFSRDKYIKLTKDCQDDISKPSVGMFIKGGLLLLDAALVLFSMFFHCTGKHEKSVRWEVYATSCAAAAALVGAIIMVLTTDNLVCPDKAKDLWSGAMLTLVVIVYDIVMYNYHRRHVKEDEQAMGRLRCARLHRLHLVNVMLAGTLLAVVAALIFMQVRIAKGIPPGLKDCPNMDYSLAKCNAAYTAAKNVTGAVTAAASPTKG